MGYEICGKCQEYFPDYLIDRVKLSHINPLCPICHLDFLNKLFRRPVWTPFGKPNWDEAYEEALQIKQRPRIRNWGGHMINPGGECEYSLVSDGVVWVDLGCCQANCKASKACSRFLKFQRMTDKERSDELLDSGVFIKGKKK